MARPREFDEATVKAALRDVFWKHGFEGASYPDIMKATGLKKGSLYASFGDKRALYQHAIADYNANFVDGGVSMLSDASLTPKARIAALFDGIIDSAGTPQGRWGCLLCNAAVEQSPFDKETETAIEASLSRLRKAIMDCVADTPAQDSADIIWSAYFGGRVLVKAGYDAKTMSRQKDQILALFN